MGINWLKNCLWSLKIDGETIKHRMKKDYRTWWREGAQVSSMFDRFYFEYLYPPGNWWDDKWDISDDDDYDCAREQLWAVYALLTDPPETIE